MEEECASLRRKAGKYKKLSVNPDEVLEEKVRHYKALMQCPCCSVRPKNCVITKCFHVFCMQCLQTRYETRQRKCPTCGEPFGLNDFHEVFL